MEVILTEIEYIHNEVERKLNFPLYRCFENRSGTRELRAEAVFYPKKQDSDVPVLKEIIVTIADPGTQWLSNPSITRTTYGRGDTHGFLRFLDNDYSLESNKIDFVLAYNSAIKNTQPIPEQEQE